MMEITKQDIDDVAEVFDQLLDEFEEELEEGRGQVYRAGVIKGLNGRGPLAQAIRQRFDMTDQEAQDIIDDALGNTK